MLLYSMCLFTLVAITDCDVPKFWDTWKINYFSMSQYLGLFINMKYDTYMYYRYEILYIFSQLNHLLTRNSKQCVSFFLDSPMHQN